MKKFFYYYSFILISFLSMQSFQSYNNKKIGDVIDKKITKLHKNNCIKADSSILKKLSVDFEFTGKDLDYTNFTSWEKLFAAGEYVNPKVVQFRAIEQIEQFSIQQWSKLENAANIEGKGYVNQTILNRISSKVDFAKEDLIIVYAIGVDNISSTLKTKESKQEKTITFYIENKDNSSTSSFTAYTVAKGYRIN